MNEGGDGQPVIYDSDISAERARGAYVGQEEAGEPSDTNYTGDSEDHETAENRALTTSMEVAEGIEGQAGTLVTLDHHVSERGPRGGARWLTGESLAGRWP